MGRLITLTEARGEADYYFEDAYWTNDGSRYVFPWPNDSFPHAVGMHSDIMRFNNKLKISIRKWIEATLTETVILAQVDNSYSRLEDPDKPWGDSYRISNRWNVFYFEEETTATMFRLCFSEFISKVTKEHPEWLE